MPLSEDDRTFLDLHRRLARLERRCRLLQAVVRLFVVLFRVLKPDLAHVRFAGSDKHRLLRAVGTTRGVLGLRRAPVDSSVVPGPHPVAVAGARRRFPGPACRP